MMQHRTRQSTERGILRQRGMMQHRTRQSTERDILRQRGIMQHGTRQSTLHEHFRGHLIALGVIRASCSKQTQNKRWAQEEQYTDWLTNVHNVNLYTCIYIYAHETTVCLQAWAWEAVQRGKLKVEHVQIYTKHAVCIYTSLSIIIIGMHGKQWR